MQERRSIVRTPYACRIQYCSSEDFLPRDGQLVNMSERGAGILIREVPHDGDRLTLNVPIAGEEEGLTATGIIRWSGTRPSRGRWYPAGLEWLPLEEAMRQRLHDFLQRQNRSEPAPKSRSKTRRLALPKPALLIGALLIPLAMLSAFLAFSFRSLSTENRQLQGAISQRNVLISHLQQKEQTLQAQLSEAKIQLASSLTEVDRLDAHTQHLTSDVARLTSDVERVQQSYHQLQDEREALIRRVMDLEQERLILSRHLASLPHLRVAIREAIEGRKHTQRDAWRRRIESKRAASRPASGSGNRGYLLWQGRSTARSTTFIRVHDPQAVSSEPSGAAGNGQ